MEIRRIRILNGSPDMYKYLSISIKEEKLLITDENTSF